MGDDADVDGLLQVTDDGTVPAPDWYAAYEGPVEIVTPAFSIVIESRDTVNDSPRKLAGEIAPFPMDTDAWHRYGTVEGKGLDKETADKTARTHPDKILFELSDEQRLYRIAGLTSIEARRDC
ncbi:putative RNA-binding protein, contains TRAM domain [Halanaeroarchaeum sp. HSR-CO]|uniref:hypothetical protein n=1 Tax=Halanaeroarchaeum sp. HSR-CO TaxID=2866382 RepID=UPI00217D99BB|nr:hypothetical protein [Halanaeroarchaeum sp. HSR-CO]UWG47724.1 putative RNA-binding protein, contains TRAM domain [Halanaeroarchaeum sp. HSR-CO]